MSSRADTHRHHGRGRRYTYHPFEVAFCGYSGSGKTTLVCELLRRWSPKYRVGFVKHDAHRFEMDRPGKDTYEAMAAGAAVVTINDPRHFARISTLPYSRFEQSARLIDADFVLAEGFKRSDLPKMLLLDEEGRALSELREGCFTNVLAVVGPGAEPAELDLPYFHRDDVDGIAAFVEAYLAGRAVAPLYGLVLVGGQSRRMGRPKWALDYTGRPQVEVVAELLTGVCEGVFLSARGDEGGLPNLPLIADRFPYRGPVNGILSAMDAHSEAAWLVVACDLPFLDEATLRDLIAGRNPFKIATAYTSANDGLPEPLCAVWEPRSKLRLLEAAGLDLLCPRKILIESSPQLLELDRPRALDNVNTPEEYEAALAELQPH